MSVAGLITRCAFCCSITGVPSPGGAFVFWVDQSEGLLRRLDYPAMALVPEFIARDPDVTNLELYADLHGAAIKSARWRCCRS